MKKTNTKKRKKYVFHIWKKQLLIVDIISALSIVFLLGIFRLDYLLMTVYFLLIPYLIFTRRKVLFYHLLVSSLVSFVWIMIANSQYSYNKNFLSVSGISIYPLFAWATGLFFMYLLYSHYEHKFDEKGYPKKLLLFTSLYSLSLIFVETVAYHVFNIQNEASSIYPGLPICDCIHAPVWMIWSYFLLGPIFFSICYALKLENPHSKKR